jgi:putative endonuclease
MKRRHAYARGRWAERLAAGWLRLKGYRILARNLRGRGGAGEIDILARRGEVLAVVEVKARAGADDEPVTARQWRRLERAALAQAARLGGEVHVRFDLMLILPWRRPRHIMDAWRP